MPQRLQVNESQIALLDKEGRQSMPVTATSLKVLRIGGIHRAPSGPRIAPLRPASASSSRRRSTFFARIGP